ncbi:hypothetical protein PCASD_13360 [Puccinia coronata f. sp. avenae]|uniref:Uncharacterized protein n=1 Tax=Puccinia coronata f. sp. avenae TaxID=200324 RepID=A0A2N5U4I6_9BASI|nr:hypothetical protein PCASD_13360 [Puccinia coronata f. sp. avenae]
MDDVRPWIVRKVVEGPLEHLKSSMADPSLSVLPLAPFRTCKIQFIRFLSPHQWGSHQPVWAEASDRDVTILVYLSSEIMQKFESDQLADTRTFGQLSYPTFFLGGCRWIWDAPPNKSRDGKQLFAPQLCLKVVSDLPNKSFRIGSVVPSPASRLVSHTDSKNSRNLYLLDFALRNHSEWKLKWNLLVNKLRVTNDPRLLASAVSNQSVVQNSTDSNPSVHVSIPHPGTSRRPGAIKARKKQSEPFLKPSTTPTHPLQATSCQTNHPSRSHEEIDSLAEPSKKKRRLVVRTSVSKAGLADESTLGDDHDTETSHVASEIGSPDRICYIRVADGSIGHQSKSGLFDGFKDGRRDPEVVNGTLQGQSLRPSFPSGPSSRLENQVDRGGIQMTDMTTTPSINSRQSTTSCTTANVKPMKIGTSVVQLSNSPSGEPTLNCVGSTSVQVGGVEAQQGTAQVPPALTPIPECQAGSFSIYFPSGDFQDTGHSNVAPSHTLSSKPVALKIKGRKLSKYFVQRPVICPYHA